MCPAMGINPGGDGGHVPHFLKGVGNYIKCSPPPVFDQFYHEAQVLHCVRPTLCPALCPALGINPVGDGGYVPYFF